MKKLYLRAVEFSDQPRDKFGEDVIYPDSHSVAIIVNDYLRYVWDKELGGKVLNDYYKNGRSYGKSLVDQLIKEGRVSDGERKSN